MRLGCPAHSPRLQTIEVVLYLRHVDVLQFRTLLRFHHHPIAGIEMVDLDAVEGQLRPPAGAAAVARFIDELTGRHVLRVVLHADLAVVEPEFAVAEEEVGEVGGGGGGGHAAATEIFASSKALLIACSASSIAVALPGAFWI